MQAKAYLKNTEILIYAGLFVMALIYINFFTLAVPYFWDCPSFIFHNPNSIKHFIKETLTLTQGRLENDRPFMNLIFYLNTLFSGRDYFHLRLLKNVFFSSYIVLSYIFIRKFIKDRFYVLMGVVFIFFSFPVFVHEVVLSEPFIYTEPFKILTFLIFLYDFSKERTSVLRQLTIALLLHLIFKSYSPNYSAFLTLFLFLLLFDYKKVKRYSFLLIYLLAVNFPIGKIINPSFNRETSRVALNITQFKLFFFKDFLKNLLALPSFKNIYNKRFLQIITPPLFLTSAYYLTALISNSYNKFTKEHRMALCFGAAYLFPELLLWFLLPEPASRYFSSQVLPVALFIVIIFFSADRYLWKLRSKKIFVSLIFLIYIFYNFAYTYMFRATWLSTEIGKRKVADYIENIRNQDTVVLFTADNAAPSYTPLRKYGEFYKQPDGIIYFAAENYSNQNLKTIRDYKEIYVVQKETSFRRNKVPDINFDSRKDLALINIIEGKTDSAFDRTNSFICKILNINYQPNKFYIYRHTGT